MLSSLILSHLSLPPVTLFPYTTLFRSHWTILTSTPKSAMMGTKATLRNVSLKVARKAAAAAIVIIHPGDDLGFGGRSEEHTSELQSRGHLVCRLLLEKKKHYRRNASCG